MAVIRALVLLLMVSMTGHMLAGSTYDYIAPEEAVPYPTGGGKVYADLSKPSTSTPAVVPMYPGASKRWEEKTGQSSTPANEAAHVKVTSVNSGWFFAGWTKGHSWTNGDVILSTETEYVEASALPYYQVQKTSGDYSSRAGKINEWANNNKDKCEFYFANFTRVKAISDDVDATVNCSPVVNQEGDQVTLSATNTSSDKAFAYWTRNGNVVSDQAIYSFTVSNENYGEYKAVFMNNELPASGSYVLKNIGTQKYASYGTDILLLSSNRDKDLCAVFSAVIGNDGVVSSLNSENDDFYAMRSALIAFAQEVMDEIGSSTDPTAFVNAASLLHVEPYVGGYRIFVEIPQLTCGKSWDEIVSAIDELVDSSTNLSKSQKLFIGRLLDDGVLPGIKYFAVASSDGNNVSLSTDGSTNYSLWNLESPEQINYALTDGWSRLRNVGTGNYASFVGDDFTISQNIDFDGIAAMKSLDVAESDPGSVFYIKNSTGQGDIFSQGYGIRSGCGEWMNISMNEEDNSAWLYVSGYGQTYYLNDKGDGRLNGLTSGTNATTHWSLEPITSASMDKFFFGAKCGAKFTDGEKYYTTMYTYFPYQCMDGVKAYYAKEVEMSGDGVGSVVCQEITTGKVPANTAVILECSGLTPKENRLVPLPCNYNYTGNPRFLTCTVSLPTYDDNLLIGTYFNLAFNGHINRTQYDPEKHLAFSISDGKLGFYRLDVPSGTKRYLTPAKAYLDKTKLSDASANSFTLTFVNGEAEGIEQVRPAVRMVPMGVYDLQGRKVADSLDGNVSLPKGIYIVNGHKMVVK